MYCSTNNYFALDHNVFSVYVRRKGGRERERERAKEKKKSIFFSSSLNYDDIRCPVVHIHIHTYIHLLTLIYRKSRIILASCLWFVIDYYYYSFFLSVSLFLLVLFIPSAIAQQLQLRILFIRCWWQQQALQYLHAYADASFLQIFHFFCSPHFF